MLGECGRAAKQAEWVQRRLRPAIIHGEVINTPWGHQALRTAAHARRALTAQLAASGGVSAPNVATGACGCSSVPVWLPGDAAPA